MERRKTKLSTLLRNEELNQQIKALVYDISSGKPADEPPRQVLIVNKENELLIAAPMEIITDSAKTTTKRIRERSTDLYHAPYRSIGLGDDLFSTNELPEVRVSSPEDFEMMLVKWIKTKPVRQCARLRCCIEDAVKSIADIISHAVDCDQSGIKEALLNIWTLSNSVSTNTAFVIEVDLKVTNQLTGVMNSLFESELFDRLSQYNQVLVCSLFSKLVKLPALAKVMLNPEEQVYQVNRILKLWNVLIGAARCEEPPQSTVALVICTLCRLLRTMSRMRDVADRLDIDLVSRMIASNVEPSSGSFEKVLISMILSHLFAMDYTEYERLADRDQLGFRRLVHGVVAILPLPEAMLQTKKEGTGLGELVQTVFYLTTTLCFMICNSEACSVLSDDKVGSLLISFLKSLMSLQHASKDFTAEELKTMGGKLFSDVDLKDYDVENINRFSATLDEAVTLSISNIAFLLCSLMRFSTRKNEHQVSATSQHSCQKDHKTCSFLYCSSMTLNSVLFKTITNSELLDVLNLILRAQQTLLKGSQRQQFDSNTTIFLMKTIEYLVSSTAGTALFITKNSLVQVFFEYLVEHLTDSNCLVGFNLDLSLLMSRIWWHIVTSQHHSMLHNRNGTARQINNLTQDSEPSLLRSCLYSHVGFDLVLTLYESCLKKLKKSSTTRFVGKPSTTAKAKEEAPTAKRATYGGTRLRSNVRKINLQKNLSFSESALAVFHADKSVRRDKTREQQETRNKAPEPRAHSVRSFAKSMIGLTKMSSKVQRRKVMEMLQLVGRIMVMYAYELGADVGSDISVSDASFRMLLSLFQLEPDSESVYQAIWCFSRSQQCQQQLASHHIVTMMLESMSLICLRQEATEHRKKGSEIRWIAFAAAILNVLVRYENHLVEFLDRKGVLHCSGFLLLVLKQERHATCVWLAAQHVLNLLFYVLSEEAGRRSLRRQVLKDFCDLAVLRTLWQVCSQGSRKKTFDVRCVILASDILLHLPLPKIYMENFSVALLLTLCNAPHSAAVRTRGCTLVSYFHFTSRGYGLFERVGGVQQLFDHFASATVESEKDASVLALEYLSMNSLIQQRLISKYWKALEGMPEQASTAFQRAMIRRLFSTLIRTPVARTTAYKAELSTATKQRLLKTRTLTRRMQPLKAIAKSPATLKASFLSWYEDVCHSASSQLSVEERPRTADSAFFQTLRAPSRDILAVSQDTVSIDRWDFPIDKAVLYASAELEPTKLVVESSALFPYSRHVFQKPKARSTLKPMTPVLWSFGHVRGSKLYSSLKMRIHSAQTVNEAHNENPSNFYLIRDARSPVGVPDHLKVTFQGATSPVEVKDVEVCSFGLDKVTAEVLYGTSSTQGPTFRAKLFDFVIPKASPKLQKQVFHPSNELHKMDATLEWNAIGSMEDRLLKLIIRTSRSRRVAKLLGSTLQHVSLWEIKSSVFAARPTIVDSRSFLNTSEMYAKAFDSDWSILMKRESFTAFLDMFAKRETIYGGVHNIETLKACIREQYYLLCSVFQFYSTHGNSNGDSVCLSSLLQFAEDAQLLSQTVKKIDVENICRYIFARGCTDELLTQQERSVQQKSGLISFGKRRSLLRFGCLEFIIRVAELKYVRNKHTTSLVEACELLMKLKLSLFLDAEPVLRTDHFRGTRLYTREVDLVLWQFLEDLSSLYAEYATSSSASSAGMTRGMTLSQFHAILEHLHLYDTNLTILQAGVVFKLSQFEIVHHVRDWMRLSRLSLFDFLEAMCRIADIVIVPTKQEMIDLNVKSLEQFYRVIVRTRMVDVFCKSNSHTQTDTTLLRCWRKTMVLSKLQQFTGRTSLRYGITEDMEPYASSSTAVEEGLVSLSKKLGMLMSFVTGSYSSIVIEDEDSAHSRKQGQDRISGAADTAKSTQSSTEESYSSSSEGYDGPGETSSIIDNQVEILVTLCLLENLFNTTEELPSPETIEHLWNNQQSIVIAHDATAKAGACFRARLLCNVLKKHHLDNSAEQVEEILKGDLSALSSKVSHSVKVELRQLEAMLSVQYNIRSEEIRLYSTGALHILQVLQSQVL